MIIGDDEAVGGDNDAGAESVLNLPLGVSVLEGFFKEVAEESTEEGFMGLRLNASVGVDIDDSGRDLGDCGGVGSPRIWRMGVGDAEGYGGKDRYESEKLARCYARPTAIWLAMLWAIKFRRSHYFRPRDRFFLWRRGRDRRVR